MSSNAEGPPRSDSFSDAPSSPRAAFACSGLTEKPEPASAIKRIPPAISELTAKLPVTQLLRARCSSSDKSLYLRRISPFLIMAIPPSTKDPHHCGSCDALVAVQSQWSLLGSRLIQRIPKFVWFRRTRTHAVSALPRLPVDAFCYPPSWSVPSRRLLLQEAAQLTTNPRTSAP